MVVVKLPSVGTFSSFSKIAIVTGVSNCVTAASSTAFIVGIGAFTVTVTIAVLQFPKASHRVYSKVSSPIKPLLGV